MSVKVNYKGKMVDAYDYMDLLARDQQSPPSPMPVIDVASLPDLLPDEPVQKLGDYVPEVRRFITADGKVRSGLKAEDQKIAEQILKRYGGVA